MVYNWEKLRKQSRFVCVKCQADRELPSGRKKGAVRRSFCGTQTASRCEEDKFIKVISFVV